jgi:cupin 2 domain-containing protein
MSASSTPPSPQPANLFAGVPGDLPDELSETLLQRPGVRVERIVSRGQASPEGFWYDQPEDEWVALLSGRAVLGFADGTQQQLQPGDYVMIPAGCRHRVEQTAAETDTVWLAVHVPPNP